MNYRLVVSQLGLLFLVQSAIMLVMSVGFFGIESWMQREVDPTARRALLMSGAGGLVLGSCAWWLTRAASRQVGRREALLLVGVSWLAGAAFAGLPFYIYAHTSAVVGADHPFRSFVGCYFEAMSGLTTTGASVLADVESLPRSLLLWRATTHWLGGLGIVVLFVAVLPSLGVGGRRLFSVEATGPSKASVRPHIRDTARTLWYIYLALSIAEVLALKTIGGMSWFDAICHTFSTIATGGFSNKNASIAAYDSLAVEIIVTVFMVASGVNFALYYALVRGRWQRAWRDPELRLYLLLFVLGSLVMAFSLSGRLEPITLVNGQPVDATFANSLRHATFAAATNQTTTGFGTADYSNWPFLAHVVIILLMFAGGCAGSTAGGLKTIRIWIAFKVLHREIERVFRPHIVRPVMIAGTSLDPETKLSSIAYVLGFVLLFAAGLVGIVLLERIVGRECDFTTAATSSLACLSNVGPGLGQVGPAGNYGFLSGPTQLLLCMLMALGRLEVFAIIVLITPRFWRER